MNMKTLILKWTLFLGVVSTLTVFAFSQLQTMIVNQAQLKSAKTQTPTDLVQIEKTIAHLQSEIADLEKLEKQSQDKTLGQALEIGVQLKQKEMQYGSIQTLQANLRVLNEIKADIELRDGVSMKTSAAGIEANN